MANISLFIGGIRPLPESGRHTGMYKQPVNGPLELGPEGFVGDQQADRRVHGGPDKAVHLYPAAHYARLAGRFPAAASQLVEKLVQSELIERMEAPNDRRAKQLSLSKKGAKLVEQGIEERHRWMDELAGDISAEESGLVVEALEILIRAAGHLEEKK